MQHFFFHVEHVRLIKDDVGSRHDDIAAAKRHAAKLFGEILVSDPQIFWNADVFRMTVAKADGLVLFSLEMIATMAPAVGSDAGAGGTSRRGPHWYRRGHEETRPA
jgi:hypothetical protein